MTKQAPKICFVHGQLGLGGAEVLRLSILKEMVRRNANVNVVELRQPGELSKAVKDLGVPIESLGNRGGLFDLAGVRKLSAYLKQNRFDIVQSSQFITNLHTGFACRSAGVKHHIIEEHGIYRWKKFRHRWLDRTFNAKAAAVIACSRSVAESAAGFLNIPVSKIDVVHNCVGEEHLVPTPADWQGSSERLQRRQELTSSKTVKHVSGIVGTLRWEKGHRFLLEAWSQLHASGKVSDDHHLLVVGDGPLMPDLKELANDLPNVHFLGSRSDTRSVLQAMDLFVLPSVNEGFGIAIIEAMAAGVPVVSTASGGIPEVIVDGTGFLVPSEDSKALASAMADAIDHDDIESIIAAAQNRVLQRFTPAAYVDRLEAIHDRLLTI
jgi:glycosyltransferase involved in cell wall biosynthesis